MLKKIIVSTFILLILLFSLIAWGLYLMEIEDHYGDLQNVYLESKSGDLILNTQTRNFGVISKDWKRANIITKQNDTLDLYDFVNQNKYDVFRCEKDFDLGNLTFEKIIELKNRKVIETILSN
ncbi:hypothetical protein K6T82_08530 [Flavobacterium sp. 17A]|uniref:Uncharacterized protein n=1 Tax=Flavobacterium potami TaxID=2872310 RepID=A0A9X1KPT8_9FLAO|nr:hypothetical protein [Flavobacterium potami]MBZ4034810.1 hypothetical protein [Flavobacterium potami]